MIEPSLDAPLDVHRATVLPEWIDWNGHMNVGFYVVAFDKATDTLCNQFGCSWDYTREKIGMTFVIEAHVTLVLIVDLVGGPGVVVCRRVVGWKRKPLEQRQRDGIHGASGDGVIGERLTRVPDGRPRIVDVLAEYA